MKSHAAWPCEVHRGGRRVAHAGALNAPDEARQAPRLCQLGWRCVLKCVNSIAHSALTEDSKTERDALQELGRYYITVPLLKIAR